MGTLCYILLQLTPADTWQSEKQLGGDSQPVIKLMQYVPFTAMSGNLFALASRSFQDVAYQPRVRVILAEEDEGNIQDGFILHEPAPT